MNFQPGDIAACYGSDWTGRFISLGTASFFSPPKLLFGPSHVAILCEVQGDLVWVESTTLCRSPCLIRGEPVAGAQAHRPRDRINDYVLNAGKVDLYRLTPINKLSAAESQLLSAILINHFVRSGKQYDMAGALLSGTRAFQLSRLFPGANLDELFCSELVAAVAMRLNRMNHSNPTRFHPARLMRQLVRSGKYHFVETIQEEL
ncbi:hypothetical protein [Thalassoglobus polymorphus]|uniref:Uncharacterized protein n=1 Tax=Thalassoglobus polymorphus TaxID=2527994 RepID=A0A517QHA2_9PLAN|nr:hypothetical protein [Thalassoglobus polymorphus]QDT31011.1 hypothetical protein Mal48_02410 [Thalassoglobus polymorphus]